MKGFLLLLALSSARGEAERPDVVLVTLESVRADRLGRLRGGASITPALDSLGRQGVVFEEAYSAAPWTVPSLASLMSSRPSEYHGAVLPAPRLEPGLSTLARSLRAAGYRTGAFVSGAPSDPGHGLTRDFDYVEAFATKTPDMEDMVERSRRWLSASGEGPRFVWIHAFNTHLPYQCPEPHRDRHDPGYDGPLHRLGPEMNPGSLATASLAGISKLIYHYNGYASDRRKTPHYPLDDELMRRLKAVQASPADVAHLEAHYDGCIGYSDEQIGRLKSFLESRQGRRPALWVVTSDHGEYLGRTAWSGEPRISHPFADLHEELLRVPLIIAQAGLPPARVAAPVGLVDVAPTVLGRLGLPAPSGMMGRDLFSGDPGPVYASDYDPDESRWVRAIRRDGWKLLRSTYSWNLFDLSADPGERSDLARVRPNEFLEAGRGLLEYGADARDDAAPAPAGGVAPRHLRLEISPDLAAQSFSAVVTHHLELLRPARRVDLRSEGLRIASVTDASGSPLRFRVFAGTLSVFFPEELAAGREVTLKISYSGGQRHMGLHFFRRDPVYPGRPDAVWSHGQPDRTSHWIPVIDEPAYRCPTEVVVTVPEGFQAVSNGVLVSKKKGPGGTLVSHWRQSRPHPVHLIALYVARYEFLSADGRGTRLGYWIPPGSAESARRTFAALPKMLEFFARVTGTAYPWDRYDIAVIHQSRFGGMENTSAAALREDFLLDKKAALDFDHDFALAHELAHQWYGNLISCRGWEHVWLNEGLASYLQSLWSEHDRGPEEFERGLEEKARKYLLESRRYRRPLAGAAGEAARFDSHAYEKGAWVLHMLRRRSGDAVFWQALRGYTARHKDGAADSEDLRRAFEEAGAGELKDFFGQWVHGAGHPVLAVSMRWEAESGQAVLEISQKQNGPLFRLPLAVELTWPGGSRRVHMPLSGRKNVFRWPLPRKPSMVRVDPEFALLAEFELDFPVGVIAAQLRGDPSVGGRMRAARALSFASDKDSLDALRSCLLGDAFWGVSQACAESLSDRREATALSALVAAASHAEPRIRRAAAAGLGRFSGSRKAFAALKPLAEGDSSWAVQAAALESLGSLGLPEVRPLLLSALDAESWNDLLPKAALSGLGRLGDPRLLAVLKERAAAGKPAGVRAAALRAMAPAGKRSPGEARDFLLEALSTEDDRLVRSAAVAALGELGGREAEAALRRLAIQDPEDEMRRLAAEAASRLGERR
jgi:aminopeptidase N